MDIPARTDRQRCYNCCKCFGILLILGYALTVLFQIYVVFFNMGMAFEIHNRKCIQSGKEILNLHVYGPYGTLASGRTRSTTYSCEVSNIGGRFAKSLDASKTGNFELEIDSFPPANNDSSSNPENKNCDDADSNADDPETQDFDEDKDDDNEIEDTEVNRDIDSDLDTPKGHTNSIPFNPKQEISIEEKVLAFCPTQENLAYIYVFTDAHRKNKVICCKAVFSHGLSTLLAKPLQKSMYHKQMNQQDSLKSEGQLSNVRTDRSQLQSQSGFPNYRNKPEGFNSAVITDLPKSQPEAYLEHEHKADNRDTKEDESQKNRPLLHDRKKTADTFNLQDVTPGKILHDSGLIPAQTPDCRYPVYQNFYFTLAFYTEMASMVGTVVCAMIVGFVCIRGFDWPCTLAMVTVVTAITGLLSSQAWAEATRHELEDTWQYIAYLACYFYVLMASFPGLVCSLHRRTARLTNRSSAPVAGGASGHVDVEQPPVTPRRGRAEHEQSLFEDSPQPGLFSNVASLCNNRAYQEARRILIEEHNASVSVNDERTPLLPESKDTSTGIPEKESLQSVGESQNTILSLTEAKEPLVENHSSINPLPENVNDTTPLMRNQSHTTPAIENQRDASHMTGNQKPTSPVIGNVRPTTPVIGKIKPTTSVIGNIKPTTPVIGNIKLTTPLNGNQGATTPLNGNKRASTPVTGNQSAKTPVVGNLGTLTPCVGNQRASTSEIRNQSIATPIAGNESATNSMVQKNCAITPGVGNERTTTPVMGNQSPYPATPMTQSPYPTTPMTQSPYPNTPAVESPYPTTSMTQSPYPTTSAVESPYPTTPVVESPYLTTFTTQSPYPTTPAVESPYPTTSMTQSPYPTTSAVENPYPTTPVVESPYPTTSTTQSPYPTTSAVESPYPTTPAVESPYPTTPVVGRTISLTDFLFPTNSLTESPYRTTPMTESPYPTTPMIESPYPTPPLNPSTPLIESPLLATPLIGRLSPSTPLTDSKDKAHAKDLTPSVIGDGSNSTYVLGSLSDTPSYADAQSTSTPIAANKPIAPIFSNTVDARFSQIEAEDARSSQIEAEGARSIRIEAEDTSAVLPINRGAIPSHLK